MNSQDALIERYMNLVLEANKAVNLTRIESNQSAKLLHIEDSLAALEEIDKAPFGLYGDLGTGGGFPGVPLAIKTARETVLVESVGKKIKIVDSILRELRLDEKIKTYNGRIEDLSRERPCEFSVLTARALSCLSSLLELASPLLVNNGFLVCYKSHISEEEFNDSLQVASYFGLEYLSRRQFYLSDGTTYREIITYIKVGTPEIELPRRVGLAQNKPFHVKH